MGRSTEVRVRPPAPIHHPQPPKTTNPIADFALEVSFAPARHALRTEFEWFKLGYCWWAVQDGAKRSEKQQDEMKETNRKKVIKTTLKFMKSENRWVVKDRWAEAMMR